MGTMIDSRSSAAKWMQGKDTALLLLGDGSSVGSSDAFWKAAGTAFRTGHFAHLECSSDPAMCNEVLGGPVGQRLRLVRVGCDGECPVPFELVMSDVDIFDGDSQSSTEIE